VVDEAESNCKKERVLRLRNYLFQGNEIILQMEKTFLKQMKVYSQRCNLSLNLSRSRDNGFQKRSTIENGKSTNWFVFLMKGHLRYREAVKEIDDQIAETAEDPTQLL
jgi:hypothetical protein